MIHSIPLLMSVVQVFYHDKMAAVAHLIGSDQIPKPEQVHADINERGTSGLTWKLRLFFFLLL